MFENLHNTGDDHWSASSGVAPSQPSDVDDEADNQDDDSEPEEVTPTSEVTKKNERRNVNKGKKPKTPVGHWFQEQM